MEQDATSITVYSDYVCPFCYLGRRALEDYQKEREDDLTIDWHPFDLRRHKRGPDGEIDHTIEDGKDETYFEQVRRNVDRLRAEYDADEMLDFDELPDEIDSLNAQLASYYVKRERPSRWLAFDEAIFEALWVEGRDIGAIGVLVDLAEQAGIDGEEIHEALEDETLRENLEVAFEQAARKGVTGVPTFVYEQHVASGAVPPAHLRRLVEGPSATYD